MENSQFQNNAVFFIEVGKVKPNPFQPRREFDEGKLNELAESIRMYGILQPLVVTRKEVQTPEGGLATEYELIAGERRLRASKIAGLKEVPALIRSKDESDRVKLELAIIENLQREDLNPVDRARSFQQLAKEFNIKHADIGKKVGRSREYVSNTIRLLALPEEMLAALGERKISEGHTRPLLMLCDRPEEQVTLFKEIMLKKMTVREAERISRKIAYDKVRKKDRMFDPEIVELEQEVGDTLGTRVHIEPKDKGGKIQIDYFSDDDLRKILSFIRNGKIDGVPGVPESAADEVPQAPSENPEALIDDSTEEEEESFSLSNFSI
ncbi:MAG: ParB family chromosome partitioning protein [Candidatus Paceibacteria bacterium]|jgi:ParB family chromosome partitioning protein